MYCHMRAYWRASEASKTLFSHVYGNSRYIYIYICTSVSNTHVRVNVFLRIKFKSYETEDFLALVGKSTSRNSSRSSLQ